MKIVLSRPMWAAGVGQLRRAPSQAAGAALSRQAAQELQEVTDGANLFQRLSPEVAAARCPSFQRILADMLALASEG